MARRLSFEGVKPLSALRPMPEAARGLLGAVAMVAGAGVLAGLVGQVVVNADLAMIFLLAVLGAGLAYGLGAAVTAAALAALTYNYFFLEPRLTFAIGHPGDVLTFAVFFLVALAAGSLSGRLHDRTRLEAGRAEAVAALLEASRRLSAAADRQAAADALAEQLAIATGGRAMVALPEGSDFAVVAGQPLGEVEMVAARRAWRTGQPAVSSGWSFRPLAGVRGQAALVGVEAEIVAGAEGERFVNALLAQGTVALERAQFAAQAADAQAFRKSDRLRSALLNSVSHDLRTPLSTVLGAVTTLIDLGKSIKPAVRTDLLLSIREEAERLNRYVGDLLDLTRLAGGARAPRRDWVDLREVLVAALERLGPRLADRRIVRDLPPELTLVRADSALLEQALVNILENAVAYSQPGSTIEAAAYEDMGNVVVAIEDEGRGIPTGELEQVFERFRRLEEPSDRGKGAGLGLAIAKGFVEAMGGRIAAASPIQDGRGTRILISLKKEIATPGHML
jgi:two-component system sensor histidine kinase KdpD